MKSHTFFIDNLSLTINNQALDYINFVRNKLIEDFNECSLNINVKGIQAHFNEEFHMIFIDYVQIYTDGTLCFCAYDKYTDENKEVCTSIDYLTKRMT